MNTDKRHRFPPDFISYATWLYYRFNLSHRDIEGLPAERDITVTRESIRLRCIWSGTIYASRLKREHRGYGDIPLHYGEVVDVYLQAKQDGTAAKCFFKRLLRSHKGEPRRK